MTGVNMTSMTHARKGDLTSEEKMLQVAAAGTGNHSLVLIYLFYFTFYYINHLILLFSQTHINQKWHGKHIYYKRFLFQINAVFKLSINKRILKKWFPQKY